jgi:hypothetical protein
MILVSPRVARSGKLTPTVSLNSAVAVIFFIHLFFFGSKGVSPTIVTQLFVWHLDGQGSFTSCFVVVVVDFNVVVDVVEEIEDGTAVWLVAWADCLVVVEISVSGDSVTRDVIAVIISGGVELEYIADKVDKEMSSSVKIGSVGLELAVVTDDVDFDKVAKGDENESARVKPENSSV